MMHNVQSSHLFGDEQTGLSVMYGARDQVGNGL
jgi:hypothetical protein